jgi:hypothetical protein
MPRQLDPLIADVLRKYGEDPTDEDNVVWDCHGTWVVYHRAVERMAVRAGVLFDPPQVLRAERDEAVILAFARLGDRADWDIGECLVGVNYRVAQRQAAYVYAMAVKRARDRVILKLIGLQGLLYSEAEADEFRDPGERPAEPEPPPRVRLEGPELADALIRAITKRTTLGDLVEFSDSPKFVTARESLPAEERLRVTRALDSRRVHLNTLEGAR